MPCKKALAAQEDVFNYTIVQITPLDFASPASVQYGFPQFLFVYCHEFVRKANNAGCG